MLTDALQRIDQVGVGINPLQAAGGQQSLSGEEKFHYRERHSRLNLATPASV